MVFIMKGSVKGKGCLIVNECGERVSLYNFALDIYVNIYKIVKVFT